MASGGLRRRRAGRPRRLAAAGPAGVGAVQQLAQEFPDAATELVPLWGNVFVRDALKDVPRAEILAGHTVSEGRMYYIFVKEGWASAGE